MTSPINQAIKELTSLIHPGGIGRKDDDQNARAWGFGENGLHVNFQNNTEYEKLARDIYRKTCESGYSFSQFEKLFLIAFEGKIRQSVKPDDAEIKTFLDSLKIEPDQEFLITRDIHGILLNDLAAPPLALGPYTIYKFDTHRNLLLKQEDMNTDLLWDTRKPDYLIGINVNAKHKERAIEKADELFDKFERICRFMLGSNETHDVRILHAFGRHERNAYVFSEGKLASGSFSWHGPFQALPLDDPYFSNKELGYDKLWGYLDPKEPKPLQSKIAMAALWLGQAYEERSKPAAFIKAAISLEVLFTVNDKSVINPSILSQISETVACLLGSGSDERFALEKSLKNFYSIRSAVAHAGKLNVKDEDLRDFTLLARRALMKILRTPALSEMETPEALSMHVKKLKYSFDEI